jgi:radical SAM superfamily enzyme
VFCRPASFTPLSLRSADTLEEQLRRGRQLLLGDRFRLFFGCFQQETPTALATGLLLERCAMVLAEPDCVGLILSTRPDAIAADLPSALADLCRATGKDCLVELGVQSIHPRSLRLLNRNHGYGDFVDAVARLHAASLDAVCALGVQALKLHHLQVIRATPLEEWYHQGRVAVFALDDYLRLLLRLLPHIPAQVTLHRLCATSHPRLLVAPRWGRLAADLSGQLQALLVAADLRQGQRVGVNG